MVRFSSIAFGVLGCALSGAQSPAAPTTASIDVDFSKPGAPINPRLYGVFLEEINHGIDGGLYGEMIQNRGFEDSKAPEGFTFRNGKWRNPGGYATIFDWDPDKSIPFWSLTTSGGQGTMTLDQTNPLDPATPRSCRLDVTSAGTVGIANEGFWGVGVKKGEKYSLSFWAHGGASQPLIATLTDSSGKPISDSIHVSSVSDKWKKFEGTLTAIESDPHAKLQISTDKVGSVWFDMVSLFPKKTFKNRPNGLRNDIASMIADLQPGFVRFPGGCVVESSTVATTYNWKDTIGPLEKRQEMWNVWDYRRTSGMGIYEYLQFIEDLGAQPMYVGFAGQTCIYRRPAVVPMADMEPVVNRFTDLLDYANGPTSSEWGKARAEAGHPKPFNLNLMELGNENVGDAYTQRYEMIYPKVKAKAPNLTTIANEPQKRSETDMVDDHFYSSPQWFMNNVHLYDRRDRQDPACWRCG